MFNFSSTEFVLNVSQNIFRILLVYTIFIWKLYRSQHYVYPNCKQFGYKNIIQKSHIHVGSIITQHRAHVLSCEKCNIFHTKIVIVFCDPVIIKALHVSSCGKRHMLNNTNITISTFIPHKGHVLYCIHRQDYHTDKGIILCHTKIAIYCFIINGS